MTRASSRVYQAVHDHDVGSATGLGLQLCWHFFLRQCCGLSLTSCHCIRRILKSLTIISIIIIIFIIIIIIIISLGFCCKFVLFCLLFVTLWRLYKGRFTHSMPCPCRAHVVPMPFPCHAPPLTSSDSAVSFVKVRVVAGNIRTAPTV